MKRSLILAAHGSTIDNDANQSLFDLANRLDDGLHFDVVTPAFLSGEPNLNRILDSLPTGKVVVIPIMTSNGFYHATLPGRLFTNRRAALFQVTITPIVGTHPSIAQLIEQRIFGLIERYRLKRNETTVVIVGHGTSRNKNSGRSTLELTSQLRSQISELKFVPAFLDQAPFLTHIARTPNTHNILIIPFLIGLGAHAFVDVPTSFGLTPHENGEFPIVGKHTVPHQARDFENGIVICDLPVGHYPELADICMELAMSPADSFASNVHPMREPV